HEPFGAERGKPRAVELDDGLVRIEDPESLPGVGRRVRLDLGARELRSGGLAARRVPDHPGEVADDEDDPMAGVLEVLHFAEHDRVTEVDVRGGGLQAGLERQSLLVYPPGR